MSGLYDDLPPEAREPDAHSPLAERMRPRDFDEVLGQEHLVGKDAPLRRALDEERLGSILLWGPPGVGKTTLARMLAHKVDAVFASFSAVLSGVKDLREVCKVAEERRKRGKRTLLFVDEIHRFNKSQQDAFLPYVESGDVILVGATTENPSFELNAALLSRVTVHTLEPLSRDDLRALLLRTLEDEERGLGGQGLSADDDAIDALAQQSCGDARRALTALEHCTSSLRATETHLTKKRVEEALARLILIHDKSGEEHFNLLSAFHKSLRNSDPDAALYYMVRLLTAGEDPLVLVRRMVAMAAEDVGTADPQALTVALNALHAVKFLGLPEGRLAMGEAAVYLALAPRSNAVYRALKACDDALREAPGARVPMHLRNAPTSFMKDQGYGKGYQYAHDVEGGVADMECLPEEFAGRRFYQPTDRGFEKRIQDRLAELGKHRDRSH